MPVHLAKAALFLPCLQAQHYDKAFDLIFAARRTNEAWTPKRLIWGKPMLGQGSRMYPVFLQEGSEECQKQGKSYPPSLEGSLQIT